MPVTLNASTSPTTGLITSADASGVLQLQTNGSTGLTIDASQRVGIGTASPSVPLEVNGSFAISGAARRITGDFSSSTLSSRTAFQTSTTNGNTGVFFLPNGTAQIATIRAYNAADPTNGSFVQLQVNATAASINSDASGSGTALPLALSFGNTERARIDGNGLTTATDVSGKLILGRFSNALTDSYFALGTGSTGYTFQNAGGSANLVRIQSNGRVGLGTDSPAVRLDVNGSQAVNIVDMASGTDFDLSAGNFFTRTVNGNVTFTVSNVPASRAFAFTVEIVHTSGSITWFSGVQWPNNNTAPTLTTGRVHLFTFVTDNGGTTWRGAAQVNYNS